MKVAVARRGAGDTPMTTCWEEGMGGKSAVPAIQNDCPFSRKADDQSRAAVAERVNSRTNDTSLCQCQSPTFIARPPAHGLFALCRVSSTGCGFAPVSSVGQTIGGALIFQNSAYYAVH